MTRARWSMLVLALVGVGLVVGGVAIAADPTIKEIMNKAHKKGTGLVEATGAELKKDSPDYDILKKQAEELTSLGAALSKGKPTKGSEASWAKLTGEYNDNVKTLSEAIAKKDVDAAKTAQKALAGSCGACHGVHKGK